MTRKGPPSRFGRQGMAQGRPPSPVAAMPPRPGDDRGQFQRGLAMQRAGNLAAAVECLAAAVRLKPQDADYQAAHGSALLQLGRAGEAIEALRRALAIRSGDALTQLNLGYALLATKDHAGALDAMRRAVEFKSSWPEAYLGLGNAQRETGDLAGAERSYRRVLALSANHPGGSINLGGLLLEQGRPADARPLFEAGLRRHGERAELLYGLGMACHGAGDLAGAAAAYRRLIAIEPDRAAAFNNLAGVLAELGQEAEAIDCYERALELPPDLPEVAINLAKLWIRHGRREEARAILQRAAAAPAIANALRVTLGDLLEQAGDPAGAIAQIRAALDGDPENAAMHRRLGIALFDDGQVSPALEHLQYAFGQDEASTSLLETIGLCHLALGRESEALDWLQRAIDREPDRLDVRSSYLMALNYSGGNSAETIADRHRRLVAGWLQRRAAAAEPAPPAPRALAGRRLRVGYVSPDFLLHSCSFFFEALLEHHDRSKVETICYSNAARGDAVTERLRRLADGWRDIAAMDDAAAARLIAREDRPDILVDLAGHTSGNRLALLARPLAPVAATWLGYPNTTGLPSIGYRLTDAVADPPGPADRLFTERLVRLDGGFLAYRPHPEMPEPAPRDLQAGPTVFGCFNNHLKISSGTIALWSAILAQVPESRLVLRSRPLGDPGVAAALRRRFEAAGVASDRLRILPYRATVRAGLEDYAAIDVALDPTPYNGTTTTCEALWMGVPVVTLAGDRHAARVGASILTHAGLADLVAATPADYVQIASSLAADRARLADDRRTLRPRMAASPVADGRRLAGGIEAFFADALSKASPDPG